MLTFIPSVCTCLWNCCCHWKWCCIPLVDVTYKEITSSWYRLLHALGAPVLESTLFSPTHPPHPLPRQTQPSLLFTHESTLKPTAHFKGSFHPISTHAIKWHSFMNQYLRHLRLISLWHIQDINKANWGWVRSGAAVIVVEASPSLGNDRSNQRSFPCYSYRGVVNGFSMVYHFPSFS